MAEGPPMTRKPALTLWPGGSGDSQLGACTMAVGPLTIALPFHTSTSVTPGISQATYQLCRAVVPVLVSVTVPWNPPDQRSATSTVAVQRCGATECSGATGDALLAVGSGVPTSAAAPMGTGAAEPPSVSRRARRAGRRGTVTPGSGWWLRTVRSARNAFKHGAAGVVDPLRAGAAARVDSMGGW